ncbi:hypothetical protein [Virgibacillus sp. DJP39]|uniref:hypothetical protein n=1 Tax=Virgibacillus sp. DJP39 TaxID=3409790 RepID=UPI003BB4C321
MFNVIEKNSTIQSKNLAHQKNEIEGSIVRNGKFRRKVNLLILDDLFESGRTLGEIYNVLNSDPNVGNIYVLTVTKTRR